MRHAGRHRARRRARRRLRADARPQSRPRTCPRRGRPLVNPFRLRDRAGADRPRHPVQRRGPPRPARHLPAGRTATCTDAPGPPPGPRRRLDARPQGPAGRAPDAAHGAPRLGRAWPSTTGWRLATTSPRRSSTSSGRSPGSRSTSRSTAATRRYLALTGGSAGGHLTALAALTPDDPAFQPGFEDADTTRAGRGAALRRLRRRRLPPGCAAPSRCVTTSWRRGSCGKRGRRSPSCSRRRPRSCGSRPTPPTSSSSTALRDTLVPVDQARLFVERLRAISRRTVVYAELPGAQHAFDIFPSIRSVHVVRAIDHYLTWHARTRRERRRA